MVRLLKLRQQEVLASRVAHKTRQVLQVLKRVPRRLRWLIHPQRERLRLRLSQLRRRWRSP